MPKAKPLALKDRVTLHLGGHPKGPYKITVLRENGFVDIDGDPGSFMCHVKFLKRAKKAK